MPMKDGLFKSCMNTLETKFESMQSFVFPDVEILETAQRYVKQEKVEHKSGEVEVSIVHNHSSNFIEEFKFMSEEKEKKFNSACYGSLHETWGF